MTKKDYELIAKTIKMWAEFHKPTHEQYRDLVLGFAFELRDTNPQFNSDKFIELTGFVTLDDNYKFNMTAEEKLAENL